MVIMTFGQKILAWPLKVLKSMYKAPDTTIGQKVFIWWMTPLWLVLLAFYYMIVIMPALCFMPKLEMSKTSILKICFWIVAIIIGISPALLIVSLSIGQSVRFGIYPLAALGILVDLWLIGFFLNKV